MKDCIFCKIISGEIPSKKLYEDDTVLAFLDNSPQAPVHFLIIPKDHIAGADAINRDNAGIVAHIFSKIPQLAREQGLTNGYRIVNNCGPDGNQTVPHLHFHVLGGRAMQWPPG